MYRDVWRKFSASLPLEPLEAQIASVISEHREYVPWLEADEDTLLTEFTPEGGQQNPFLHMGLHLALREQVATDRPFGIASIHAKLTARMGVHDAEHAMLEPLAETLWEAQRNARAPSEDAYLERLLKI